MNDDLLEAINRSQVHDKIVYFECNDIVECYDYINACFPDSDYADTFDNNDRPMREVWGTDEDTPDWRVHLVSIR